MYLKRYCVYFLLLLLAVGQVSAKELRFSNRISGVTIAPGAVLFTADDLFPTGLNNPNWDAGYRYYDAHAMAVLGVDRLTLDVEAVDVDVSVVVRISSYDRNFQQSNRLDTLMVHYDGDQTGEVEQIIDYRLTDKALYATVQVLGVTMNGVPELPDFVYLENRVTVDRTYESMDFAVGDTLAVKHEFLDEQKEVEVRWPFVKGAEEFELEWTFVNSLDGLNLGNANGLRYNFKEDASRIQTGMNFYRIPMLYEAGYLVYRVRAINTRRSNGLVHRLASNWTSDQFDPDDDGVGELADVTAFLGQSQHIYAYQGHHPSLGWQATTTFAEEGKRVSSVNYFDGTMRSRQAVSKNNADSLVVVGETFYDHAGRPAVQALPVPALKYNPQLSFKGGAFGNDPGNGFNQNQAGLPFGPEVFDVDDSTDCVVAASQMGNSNGAGYYYSPNSLGQYATSGNYAADATHQHWKGQLNVPDAGGYPFVQTSYTNDGTNRVASQSTVGPQHRLGAGHDIRYFYGSADQEDLDKLFGSEVGFAEHYRKNMVVDANGQVSVSYLDGAGQTIATALAGNAPDSLLALDSNQVQLDLRKDLLKRNRLVDGALVSTTDFLVTASGDQTIEYEVLDHAFVDTCVVGHCYDCIYDLEISVIDDCGEERLLGGPVVEKVFGPDLNTVCATSPSGYDLTKLTDNLEVGHYMVVKRLKVNTEAIDFYWEAFQEDNECLLRLEDFLAAEMAVLDTSGCALTCDSCVAGTAIYDNFADFQAECAAHCATDDACDALYQAMLMDVSPGGQYAQFTTQGTALVGAAGVSVYGSPGGTTQLKPWPTTGFSGWPYLNPVAPGYVPDSIVLNGEVDPTAVTDLSISEYILNFETEWAEALVTYHPEYCYYEYCAGFSAADAYWLGMYEIETFAEAQAAGYLNGSGELNIGNDPFLTQIATYDPNYDNVLQNWITQFVVDGGSTYDLYEAILALHRCPNTAPVCGQTWGSAAATLDDEWRTLVLAYRGLQEKMKDLIYRTDAGLATCRSRADLPGSAGAWEDYLAYHPDLSNVMGVDLNSPTLVSDVQSTADSLLADYCADMCAAYRPTWTRMLEACLDSSQFTGIAAILPGILDDFEGVCALGCSYDDAFGASTTPVPYIAHNDSFYSFVDVTNYHLGSLNLGTTTLSCLENLLDVPRPAGRTSIFEEGCEGDLMGAWEPEDFDWAPNNNGGWNPSFNASQYIYAHKLGLTGYPGNSLYSGTYFPCSTNCTGTGCVPIMGQHTNNWDPLSYTLANNYPFPPALDGNDGLVAVTYDASCLFSGMNPEESAIGRDLDPSGLFVAVRGAVNLTASNVDRTPHTPYPLVVATPVIPSTTVPIVAGEIYEISMRVTNLSTADRASFSDPTYWPVLSLWTFKGGNANNGDTLIGHEVAINPAPYQWQTLSFTWKADYTGSSMSFYVKNSLQSYYGNDFGFDRIEIRKMDCCLECDDMASLYSDFITNTGADPNTDALFWEQFAGYANAQEAFNLTATDYADFHSTCTVQGGVHVITDPGDVVIDPDAGSFRLAQHLGEGVQVGDTSYQLMDYVIDVLRDGEAATSSPLLLCNTPITAPNVNPCVQTALDRAAFTAQERYESYMDSVETDFRDRYVEECLNAEERFERIHDEAEYQYTLYYYDNTGALLQTVPPEGITKVTTPTSLQQVEDHRVYAASQFTDAPLTSNPGKVDPNHGLATLYQYTSLQGIFRAMTPDKGESRTWFDNLGRAQFSRDARQVAAGTYTYSVFDGLSRPVELGEAVSSVNLANVSAFVFNQSVDVVLNVPARQDLTYTWYDDAAFTPSAFTSKNSRNRVTHTARADAPGIYSHLNHYSYDEHGNVNHLVVEIPALAAYGQAEKHLHYDYDLISGNVNSLSYQLGQPDEWLHRYHYDANNRLTTAETSRDGVFWSRDEEAFYYLHGPRMRTELGEEMVQGCDYAHTIHGWIRGVNSGSLDASLDMGRDGAGSGVNRYVGRDAWGFELGFYQGDYAAIGGVGNQWFTGLDVALTAEIKDLFNGNIAYQVIANQKLMEMGTGIYSEPLFKRYRYDQLNRIRSMDLFYDPNGLADNSWSAGSAVTTDYHTDYTYDRNGNILTLDRYAANNQRMDRLRYTYDVDLAGRLLNNKLLHVNDLDGQLFAGVDLPDQGAASTPNYSYDGTGNLLNDISEEVDNMVWDHYGKIVSVNRPSASTKDGLAFGYDAGGNRILKQVIPASGAASKQFYVRDPQGNVMGIYRLWNDNDELVVDLDELHIYGSERLGIRREPVRLAEGFFTANGSPSGQRVVATDGSRGVIISGVAAISPEGYGDRGKIVILENVTQRTVNTSNLSLVKPGTAQSFCLPVVLLHPGEKMAVVHGTLTASEVDAWYGLSEGLSDSTLHWVFQDEFLPVVDASIGLVLSEDGVAVTVDEVVASTSSSRIAFSERSVDFAVDGFTDGLFADATALRGARRKGLLTFSGSVLRGPTLYELKDHLGNVSVVVSDRKLARDVSGSVAEPVAYHAAQVRSARDFYPFGMAMPGRKFDTPAYRYGFNGKEADDEWNGDGNMCDYGFRVSDPRLGRFLSVDPLAPDYPWYTPYQFAGNKPINSVDLDGLEEMDYKFLQDSKMGESLVQILSILSLFNDVKKVVGQQNRYDVVFVKYNHGYRLNPSGETFEIHSVKEYEKQIKNHFTDAERGRNKDYMDISHREMIGKLKTGKDLIIIGLRSDYFYAGTSETVKFLYYNEFCDPKYASDFVSSLSYFEDLIETTVHEAFHLKKMIQGNSNVYEDHLEYHGEYSYYSPNFEEIFAGPEFDETLAGHTVNEIRGFILRVFPEYQDALDEIQKEETK